jgi:hypothetical protein
MHRVGVVLGSKGGDASRIIFHQTAGTGGEVQPAGSVSCVEWAGMTSVPVGPNLRTIR